MAGIGQSCSCFGLFQVVQVLASGDGISFNPWMRRCHRRRCRAVINSEEEEEDGVCRLSEVECHAGDPTSEDVHVIGQKKCSKKRRKDFGPDLRAEEQMGKSKRRSCGRPEDSRASGAAKAVLKPAPSTALSRARCWPLSSGVAIMLLAAGEPPAWSTAGDPAVNKLCCESVNMADVALAGGGGC